MIKKLVASVGVAALMLATVFSPIPKAKGANFQLTWTDTNSPVYQVTGYNLYMAINTNAFANVVSVGTNAPLSASVTNLSANLYKFYVTATNVWGESLPSMTVQTPPGIPGSQGIQLWINLK